MKLTPMGSNPQAPPVPTSNNTEARSRAVEAFLNAGQAQVQETPVANPNHITAEEMTAIRAPSVPKSNVEGLEAQEQEEEQPQEIEAPAPREENKSVSSQLALLARREKALRAKAQHQDQQLKAKEADLARREQELTTKSSQQPDLSRYIDRERLKREALQVLEEEGISYDDLTQDALLSQSKNPRYEALLSKQSDQIQKLQQALDNQQKQQVDAQAEQYQAALRQIETDVNQLVKRDPNFETIRAARAQRDVVELIEKTFKDEGYIMSVEEASAEVEDYLVEEASKLARIDKIQKRLASSQAQAKPIQKQTPPVKQTQPMKTLTNSVGSTRQMSARDRAVAAFNGTLKS